MAISICKCFIIIPLIELSRRKYVDNEQKESGKDLRERIRFYKIYLYIFWIMINAMSLNLINN